MDGERVVLARRSPSSMVKLKWTEAAPSALFRLEEAEELGAKWEGEELVTYDLATFEALFEYYEKNEYMPDND